MTAWDLEAAEREVGPNGNPWRLWRYSWSLHLDGWTHGCGRRGTRYTDRDLATAAYVAAVAEGRRAVLVRTDTLLRPGRKPKRTLFQERHYARHAQGAAR